MPRIVDQHLGNHHYWGGCGLEGHLVDEEEVPHRKEPNLSGALPLPPRRSPIVHAKRRRELYLRMHQHFSAMRNALLAALLFASLNGSAKKLIVVVHTQDALVREFRCACSERVEPGDRPTQRVVRIPGRVTWHTVGGVEPITLLTQHTDGSGVVEVVVMDAVGAIAIGYGVIETVRTQQMMSCPPTLVVPPAACPNNAPSVALRKEVAIGAGSPRPRMDVLLKREPFGEGGGERPRPSERIVRTERGGAGGGSGSPKTTAVQRPLVGR